MKKDNKIFTLVGILLALLTIFSSKCGKAQDCSDPFPFIMPVVFNTGISVEMGVWPTPTKRLGFTVGMGVISKTTYDNYTKKNRTDPTMHGYIKGQYYLVQHVSLVGMIGEQDMFADFWYGMGLRLYAPTSQTRKYAMVLEPIYTNLGMKINMGMAIAL